MHGRDHVWEKMSRMGSGGGGYGSVLEKFKFEKKKIKCWEKLDAGKDHAQEK